MNHGACPGDFMALPSSSHPTQKTGKGGGIGRGRGRGEKHTKNN